MITYIYVGLGGMMGAVSRYAIGKSVSNRSWTDFPLGTIIINITGAFILSFLLRIGVHYRPLDDTNLEQALTTGFVGAYTTFSTMSYEAFQLIQEGDFMRSAGYLSATVVFGLAAAWLGLYAAGKLVI